jgi:TolA-binding protein
MGKKRLTKKELKEDGFIVFMRRVNSFTRQNKGRVISWGIITGLFLILIFILTTIFHRWKDVSDEMLAKAQETFRKASNEEEFRKAGEKFKEILDNYPLSDSRKIALFYKGNCEYRLGEYDKAIVSLKGFIASFPQHYLTPFVREALANTYEQKRDYSRAISVYEDLIKREPKGSMSGCAWFSIGRCYQELKRYKEAKDAYQRVIKDFPKSNWVEEANSQIEKIGRL